MPKEIAVAVAVGVVIGIALAGGLLWFLEWRAKRPRRFNLPRDYFDPCGPVCTARAMSHIGEQARSEELIARVSRRLDRQIRASVPQ